MPSPQRRCADNKSARCAYRKIARKSKRKRNNLALFQSPKRPSDYQGYRAVTPDRPGNAMPVLIGAAMIAAAILLSTLITAVGTRSEEHTSELQSHLNLVCRLLLEKKKKKKHKIGS